MGTSLKESFNSGKFIVTSEVSPPKGTNLAEATRHIKLLKDKVNAINVTDNQSAIMRFPSLGLCILIKELGGESILQMTCRDRSRLALQSDLLFAYTKGVRNVLCMTGDHVTLGDHKEAKAVFDLDVVQLIKTVRIMESGQDLGGNRLDGNAQFCIGAVVNPETKLLEPQLIKFEKKIAAGAEFFQTQPIFNLDNFKRFMEHTRKYKNIKILAGVMLLTSTRMAHYVNEHVAGISVPQELIEAMASAGEKGALQKGIEIAGRTIRELKEQSICHGVHIMTIGREETVPEILAAAGL